MNEECVVGVYESLKKAEQAVRILRRGDFPWEQVSLVSSGLADKPEVAQVLEMGDDSIRDAAIGAGLGGVVGVLAGLGAVAVCGVGAIFMFGPVAAGLTAATVGAFLGGLAGWGVHRRDIEHYEQCIKNGSVLVVANGSPLELVDAKRILQETDAAEVRMHARTSSEAPEVAVS